MNSPGILRRLNDSAEVWSWAFNFFRLASGVLLLPLLLHSLSTPDLGIYYVFLGLTALVPILDNAFSFNIGRFVGYAMGGASELLPLGMHSTKTGGTPNHRLVWELLLASRALYLRLAFGTSLLLSLVMWGVVRIRVQETGDPHWTWIAAFLTVLAAGIEVYSNWWNALLRGMNEVSHSARISTITYGTKLILSCALLLAGLGLVAIPIAAICSAGLLRQLSKSRCLSILPADSRPKEARYSIDLMAKLWPNSWRVGLQLLSGYLAMNGMAILCLEHLGLQANARFGLSWQIMTIAQGMSAVWTQVSWPRVNQLRTNGMISDICLLLRPRLWKQMVTYAILAAGLIILGQPILTLLDSGKQLLPSTLLVLLLLNGFLELHFSFWTVLLTTENHVPSLKATVVTNLFALTLGAWLLVVRSSGMEALVIAPLIAGCAFNYWYWPKRGASSLKTSWLSFLVTAR
jgi:hypothetical protein